jgi:type IV secretory pathway VirB6-like protein
MWISLLIKNWRLAAAALALAINLGYIGFLRHEVRSEIARSASCEATVAQVAAQSRTAQEALAEAAKASQTETRARARRIEGYRGRVNDDKSAESDSTAPTVLLDVLRMLDGEGGDTSPAYSR